MAAEQDGTRKLPSIRTVASRAGVSTATVSNVLNARRSVAPELVARVRAAVEELGYIADHGASRLRSRRSTVAGVLVPDIANPFFGMFVAVLEEAARRDGYDLLIVSSGDDAEQETARLRALLTWRPAGVIVIPCGDTLAGYEIAAAAGVKVVAVDRIPQGIPVDGIGVNNREISAEVGRHLVARGRRNILAVGSSLAIGNVGDRWAGLRDGTEGEAGTEMLEAGFTLADNREALAARLARGGVPDALFTLNNVATLGAIEALQSAGLHVPQDVGLVGFDDADWMHVVTPPLTSVIQPIEAMGRAAWSRLLARIGGDTSPPQQLRLPCRLEIRASSALARQFHGAAAD
jgi:DNA-binding LacI/PurR family transcriptional regulator